MSDIKILNARCSICGKSYHTCNSCLEQKNFKPWRSVTDSIAHYKIYLAIHSHTITKNKENAKIELSHCDLSELESFTPEVKFAIQEILKEDKFVNKKMKVSKENIHLPEIKGGMNNDETINK